MGELVYKFINHAVNSDGATDEFEFGVLWILKYEMVLVKV